MSQGDSHLYGLALTVVGIIIVSLLLFQTSLPKTVSCIPPTILYEGTCCLDDNGNGKCDFLEPVAAPVVEATTETPSLLNPTAFSPRGPTQELYVTRVLNGETIEAGGMTIRLLGIDAPVRGEYDSAASSAYLRSLIEGKTVLLEGDGYVFLNGKSINAEMILAGHASATPPSAYQEQFQIAEDTARRDKIGLWTPLADREAIACDERCMSVFYLNYESPLRDDCVYPNDEFVTIENNCGHSCELTGWTMRDSGIARYVFPSFTLRNNERVTIFSGSGKNTEEYLFWDNQGGMCNAVWDNTGDTIYLRNIDGEVVLTHKYQGRVLS